MRDVVASEKIVRACVRQHGESSSGEQLHADTTADAREKRNKKKGREEKKDNSHAVGRDNYFYDGVVCARIWMHVHTGERA